MMEEMAGSDPAGDKIREAGPSLWTPGGDGNGDGLGPLLRLAGESFDIDRLSSEGATAESVVQYFTQSLPAYFLLHSPRGSMHMALNSGGVFDRRGYDGQARLVERHVRDAGARDVLELGCGKGYNLRRLARENPGVEFSGVDLTPWHVRVAKLCGAHRRNLRVREANFQDLPFPDGSFDLVYSVEAICHAGDVHRVAREARRVLRPGGRFVTIEPWRREGFAGFEADGRRAARLIETAFALPDLQEVDRWECAVSDLGFDVLERQDLTDAVLPNMLKLRDRALRLRALSWGRPSLPRRFPGLMGNALAALLLPETFRRSRYGCHCYRLNVFSREVAA